jgi:hypothetical protein
LCPIVIPKVKKEEKQRDCQLLRHIVTRCLSWGFSSSGVERTFARGGWVKGRREITMSLANDELRFTHYPNDDMDQFLVLDWV